MGRRGGNRIMKSGGENVRRKSRGRTKNKKGRMKGDGENAKMEVRKRNLWEGQRRKKQK
jgi:hypothetical protein